MPEALESRTFLSEELNQNADPEFSQKLQRLADTAMAERSERARLVLGKEAVELSAEVVDILRHVVEVMRQGTAVRVVPQHTMLSTQQAADLLGVSRPTLIRILDDGEIPFFLKRRHRQLCLTDVLEYQKRQRRIADESLSDIIADAEMFGEYDVDPEEHLKAAKEVRRGGQASGETA